MCVIPDEPCVLRTHIHELNEDVAFMDIICDQHGRIANPKMLNPIEKQSVLLTLSRRALQFPRDQKLLPPPPRHPTAMTVESERHVPHQTAKNPATPSRPHQQFPIVNPTNLHHRFNEHPTPVRE